MKKHSVTTTDKQVIIKDGDEVLIVDDRSEASDLKLVIGQHARVQYVWLMASADNHAIIKRQITIGDGAKLEAWQLYNSTAGAQISIDNHLGERVNFENHVLFYQSGDNKLSVTDNYHFNQPGSYGRFTIEGLVTDSAQIEYFSDLQIKPNSQKIDSRIDMKLHLLSDKCRGILLPGLQIDANDVKAGHSATTFKLAPEDLFYLESRGLSLEQIKALVMQSTVQHFVTGLEDEELKNKIIYSLSFRHSGGRA